MRSLEHSKYLADHSLVTSFPLVPGWKEVLVPRDKITSKVTVPQERLIVHRLKETMKDIIGNVIPSSRSHTCTMLGVMMIPLTKQM